MSKKFHNYAYPEFCSKVYSDFKDDSVAINQFITKCPLGEILDLGGGSGRTLSFFEDRTHILLESDPEMIDFLKNKTKSFKNKKIIAGLCPSIPLENSSIAGVFAAFGTIGELNPICITLKEIERVLVPGGYVYFPSLNPLLYPLNKHGIKRALLFNVTEFSFVANTLPMLNLGPGEYQTQITVRQQGVSQTFIVKQYFPMLDSWIHLIEQSGLELTNEISELKDSPVFNFILRKTTSHININKDHLISKIYDGVAKNYDLFISKAEYGLPEWISPHLDEYINLQPKIVDLACGNGFIGKLIKEKNINFSELIGYDISQNMVLECEKINIYNHTCRFDLKLGLPGHSALSVDLVTAFGLMDFLKSEYEILKDIFRILCIGGTLLCNFEALIDDHNSSSDLQFDKEDFIELNHKGDIILRHRRTEKSILNLLSEIGFSNIKIEKRIGYKSPTTNNLVYYYFVRAYREQL